MRHWLFAGYCLVCLVCLIWPVYAAVGRAEPFVLGLPLSMAWVVGWLIASFFALLAYHVSDARSRRLRGDD